MKDKIGIGGRIQWREGEQSLDEVARKIGYKIKGIGRWSYFAGALEGRIVGLVGAAEAAIIIQECVDETLAEHPSQKPLSKEK